MFFISFSKNVGARISFADFRHFGIEQFSSLGSFVLNRSTSFHEAKFNFEFILTKFLFNFYDRIWAIVTDCKIFYLLLKT